MNDSPSPQPSPARGEGAERGTCRRLFSDPGYLCRAALEQVARAERFTMAEWLAVRPDGQTVKAAYAEAAQLAYDLSVQAAPTTAPGSAGIPPARLHPVRGGRDARAPRPRDRRPVLVLTRELHECLVRVAAAAEQGVTLPPKVAETLAAIEALLTPEG